MEIIEDGSELAVQRSWQRCMANYGLEPNHTPPPSVLTQTELKDVRARVDDLIYVARFEIDRLFAQIGPSDYVVLLTDMRGVTVDFRCPSNLSSSARKAGLYLGSIWSEAEQGTNGVGTCVYETKPLSIVRDEHFSTRNAALTCSVAPIFAAENRLIGVLDVSTERATDHASQAIMRQIVAAAAQRIENMHFAQRHADHAILRLSRYRDFADSAAEARLALSDTGTIIEAGSNTSRLLAGNGSSVGGVDVSSLLNVPLRRLLGTGGPVQIASQRGEPLYARIEERTVATPATGGERSRRSVSGRVASARASAGSLAASANSALAAHVRAGHAPQPGYTASKADAPQYDLGLLAGDDPAMLANADVACRMINRGLPIVITGETGTGKGLFAHALHAASARATAPFVTVNCAAIPQELIESELFGYRPGAFTGASSEGFKGRLMQANTGTLFLDEIGDMPLGLQTRLLQVLSDREFTPIGATKPVVLDVAVVSATLHDLPQRVRAGQFREDLFFRLSGVTVTLPSLRHRRDRAALIRRVFEEEAGQVAVSIVPDESTVAILAAYFWPGNLRELRHMARFAVALAEGTSNVIYQYHLPPPFGGAGAVTQAHDPRTGAATSNADNGTSGRDCQIVRMALQRANWNVTAAAGMLDMSRATLHRKIKKYGLHRH